MHASGRVNKPAGLGPHKPPINWRIEGKILTGREIERKLSTTGIRCAQSGSFAFYARYTRYTAVIGVIFFFFSIFSLATEEWAGIIVSVNQLTTNANNVPSGVMLCFGTKP